MKKYFLLALSLFILESANADIIGKLSELYPHNKGRKFYYDDNYLFSLEIFGEYLYANKPGLDSVEIMIAAYQIKRDSIKLILKDTKYKYSSYDEYEDAFLCKIANYYLFEAKETAGNITFNLTKINEIDFTGFDINKGFIIRDNTDIMLAPSVNSTRYTQLNIHRDMLKINSFVNKQAIETDDYIVEEYWYEIELDNKKLYVFGYSIGFMDCIQLKKEVGKISQ